MADSRHGPYTPCSESPEAGESTSFERMDAMGTRCRSCEQGICCSLCSRAALGIGAGRPAAGMDARA